MSIAPVEGYPASGSRQSETVPTNANVRSGRAKQVPTAVAAEVDRSRFGNAAKTERHRRKKCLFHLRLARRMSSKCTRILEIKDQIIIQYLDQAKDVILQVPSNQELNVERAIAQEFQQVAKLHANATTAAATAAAGSEGEKNHGD